MFHTHKYGNIMAPLCNTCIEKNIKDKKKKTYPSKVWFAQEIDWYLFSVHMILIQTHFKQQWILDML